MSIFISYRLEDFDAYQGEDLEVLEIRERIPEPVHCYSSRRVVAVYPRPNIFSWINDSGFDSDFQIQRLEFERVKMGIGTTTFYAWKCLRDGKIYF